MQRRAFIKTTAIMINAAVALLLGIPGLRFLIPQKRKSNVSGYLRIAPLNSLAKDQPVRVQVVADRTDAFVHYSAEPIGSVWLQHIDSNDGEPKVRCFQTICPHRGCGIDYCK